MLRRTFYYRGTCMCCAQELKLLYANTPCKGVPEVAKFVYKEKLIVKRQAPLDRFASCLRYNTLHYKTIQYNTVRDNSMQYNALQYNTL
jgi:hypothetical protein